MQQRFPAVTPTDYAQVLVRSAEQLAFGDRVLYSRDGGRWMAIVTVIERFADGSYSNVLYLHDNDIISSRFLAPNRARYVVLTAGVCDNPHSGMALMCTPAPFRLDPHPFPGVSYVCDLHRKQMQLVYATEVLAR